MADSSLDDFFAKKDKSKKSKTKKFGSNNQSTKAAEDGSKFSEKGSKKEKENVNTPSNLGLQNDEEWHEYDEKEKDYSGLKIQSLQICEREKEDSEKEIEGEFNEDGELIRSDGQSGPWKVVANPEPEVPETKQDIEKPPATPNVVAGKYIPPHLLASRLSRVPMKNPRLPKVAPKIDCQNDFPTLSSAVESKNDSNTDYLNFEQVRNKTRGREEIHSKKVGPKLDLGNKYNALGADNL